MKTIFSHDPGSVNYGYGVSQVALVDGKVKFRVLENGMCPSPIKTLNSLKGRQTERDGYLTWLQGIKDKYNPDVLCGERFMTRGIKGPTVESVNIMLGMLESGPVFYPKMVKIMPAAVWKNAIKRAGVDLKAEYKRARVLPHQLDAVFIGLYTGFQGLGKKDFDSVSLHSVWDDILDQIEDTSTEPLINRKIKR